MRISRRPERARHGDVGRARQGDGAMKQNRHRNNRAVIDLTGWLLATMIVVLAVLDLLIWATLANVPNPGSKLLLGETPHGATDSARDLFTTAPPPSRASFAADAPQSATPASRNSE